MSIIFYPCSEKTAHEHLLETVVIGVETSRILPYVNKNTKQKLMSLNTKKISVWGTCYRPGSPNKGKWDKIEPGDDALFYEKGVFRIAAKIECKEQNTQLAKMLWGTNKEGETWELVVFLTDVNEKNIRWKPEEIGYKPTAHVQCMRVFENDSRICRYFEKKLGNRGKQMGLPVQRIQRRALIYHSVQILNTARCPVKNTCMIKMNGTMNTPGMRIH